MKNSLKKQIQTAVKEQKIIATRLQTLDETMRKIESYIKKYILLMWKKLNHKEILNVTILTNGSHTTNFKLKAIIRLDWHKLDSKGNWFQLDYNTGKELLIPVNLSININTLKTFANQMTKKLGMPVIESQKRIPTEKQQKKQIKQRGCKNFNDLSILLNHDIKLIKEGKIWHKGWEIPDEFIICQRISNKNWICTYSTNGHGYGFDTILDNPTKQELSTFLKTIEQDDDNSEIRKLFD